MSDCVTIGGHDSGLFNPQAGLLLLEHGYFHLCPFHNLEHCSGISTVGEGIHDQSGQPQRPWIGDSHLVADNDCVTGKGCKAV